MTDDNTLMGEAYFISPKYGCRFDVGTPVELHKNDSLAYWLMDNAIFFGNPVTGGDSGGAAEHRERLLFNGLNGVLCEIKHTFAEGGSQLAIHKELMKKREDRKKRDGYYYRVVRIRYMPSNKEIPSELTDKLRDLEYREPSEDDKAVLKDANNTFFRWI